MTMSEFAAKFDIDEEDFFDLSWSEAQALVDQHGYEFTGLGIFEKGTHTEDGKLRKDLSN